MYFLVLRDKSVIILISSDEHLRSILRERHQLAIDVNARFGSSKVHDRGREINVAVEEV